MLDAPVGLGTGFLGATGESYLFQLFRSSYSIVFFRLWFSLLFCIIILLLVRPIPLPTPCSPLPHRRLSFFVNVV